MDFSRCSPTSWGVIDVNVLREADGEEFSHQGTGARSSELTIERSTNTLRVPSECLGNGVRFLRLDLLALASKP